MKEETINDIVSELRCESALPTSKDDFNESLRGLASRIEAAAKRERADLSDAHDAIARLEAELAEARRERDSCAADNSLLARPQTGSAAAMREALENVERVARFCAETPRHTPGYSTDAERVEILYLRIWELGRIARAVLAAPARNCDRFKDAAEAHIAFQRFCRTNYNAAYAARGLDGCDDCELCETKNMSGEDSCPFHWLFAPAEGGDHA